MDVSNIPHTLIIICFLGCTSFMVSCTQPVDIEAEKARILAIHNQQRVNHFEKILEGTYDMFTDSLITVNRGIINRPTEEEFLTRRRAYFGSVEFEKWDDITPPVIRFSDDYTMAYTVVHKEVVITFENDEGQSTRSTTIFSWIAIYKKTGTNWRIDAIASTNEPEIEEGVSQN